MNTTNTTTDSTANKDRSDDDRADTEKSPEQLDTEVDAARVRLEGTASELAGRLSPDELMHRALGMVREHGGDFSRNLGSRVKNNPLPMILTGVGLSWLMLSSRDSGSAVQAPQGKSRAGGARRLADAVSDTAADSRQKASAMGDRLHDATENASASAQEARDGLTQFYREQPLLAGSLGIAIGAALGALVPPTAMEDDMLGKSSDRSIEAAKSGAARKYDEVRASARADGAV